MIDTALIKVIILTLNLIFYSSGSETAQTDMLQAGKYAGTLSYTMKDRTMTVYYGKGSPSRKMLTVKTIDNGLYSVKMDREPPFEVDLAEYFMKIDWKKFPPMNSRKIGEVNLGSSGKNFYLNYKSYTFITDRKLLQKKRKSAQNSKTDKLLREFQKAGTSGDTKKMSRVMKELSDMKIIRRGMSADEVTELLGNPVNFTGIYLSGGISLGYGKKSGSTNDTDKYYWLHFSPEKGLHSWD